MAMKRFFYFIAGSAVVIVGVLAGLLVWEFNTSTLQAKYLSKYAAKMHFRVAAGPSHAIYFPQQGPADVRSGYVSLPAITRQLDNQGFEIQRQARISPAMQQMAEAGLNLPYHEKNQVGLTLLDTSGTTLLAYRTPQRVYADFNAIPSLLRNSLLTIENRKLLDINHPERNPAVEWDRLAQAIIDKLEQQINPRHEVPGGSTLATQIEKYRHSPAGLTLTMRDKWQQMASASVRAYLDGENTQIASQHLVLDYLNTVPLSAAPGFGEVVGLPDALWAWYGLDYQQVSRLLVLNQPNAATGKAYRAVLSLLVAQRKPSYYLNVNHQALMALTDRYLRLLAQAGVISPALQTAASQARLRFNIQATMPQHDFVEQKAANALRVRLAGRLGVTLYDLDRLDLTVNSTLNGPTQQAVSQFLVSLNSAAGTARMGIYGKHLLTHGNDLSKIVYSFTLYESTPQGVLLRVQADNLNQPFDINKGAKLDLGSTAKLRTLVSYLEIVSSLHQQYQPLSAAQLTALATTSTDPISSWAVNYYQHSQDKSLPTMLTAAMARQYSANPAQVFFTGGGLHRFVNFSKDDDARTMDLWEATRNSVNLVYIRLMQDIRTYYIAQLPGVAGAALASANNPLRRVYLERFADHEGQQFLLQFYKQYRGHTAPQITAMLLADMHTSPRRLAAVYRYLEPAADLPDFSQFVGSNVAAATKPDDRSLLKLYKDYAPGAYSLTDLGYIAQIHPLELWLAGYMRTHPEATFAAAVAASYAQRIEVYRWLYNTTDKAAQDQRLNSQLEVAAFDRLYTDWKRLGYPFDSLVPSLATAIGTSADRPAALAELMGILVNNGVRLPEVSIEKIRFAAATPYETVFVHKPQAAIRLLPAALTQVVRRALQGVIEQGTAARLRGLFTDANGHAIVMGGKTGTGDHRFDTFDSSGNVLTSRVVNRTATLVFFIGDRFFGTMTALVRGSAGADYSFTSALPAQLVKVMSPRLASVLAPLNLAPIQSGPGAGMPVEAPDLPEQNSIFAMPVAAPVGVTAKKAEHASVPMANFRTGSGGTE